MTYNVTVTKEVNDVEREAKADYDFGNDLEAMRELFPDVVIFKQARANMVIGLQSLMRNALAKDEYRETDFQELADKWSPSERKQAKSKLEKADALTVDMSEAELEALQAKIIAKLEEGKEEEMD